MSHAPLAPSSAPCWINCPASIRAQIGFPDSSGRAADEGSAMHEVRARCLSRGEQPMDYLGWVFFGGTRTATLATRERLAFLQPGIDRLRDLCGDDLHLDKAQEPRHTLIEEKLHFDDPALRDVYGTLDFGAYTRNWGTAYEVVISDLKFGIGVPVYAEKNEQQLIYAALFLDSLSNAERRRIRSVRIVIDQPRIAGAGGEWVVTPEFVACWLDEVLYPAVEATKATNPKYSPGPKTCYWCRAKPACAAYSDFNIETLGISFDDERDGKNFAVDGVAELSIERRAYLARHRGMLEKFLEIVGESVLREALTGAPTPGLKAVLGNQGKRAWVNEDLASAALKEFLGEKAYESKLLTPTAAADRLPKKVMEKLADLITREPAKPKLVLEDDPKTAYVPVKMEDERSATNG